MDEMNEQGHLSFHSESSDYRGTNISEPNMSRLVVRAVSLDSHYFLDAYYDNGMTQHHGLQDQTNLDIGVPVSSNASHTEIDIPLIPRFDPWRSMIQAPTPSANLQRTNSRMNLQRDDDIAESRRGHRFGHGQYHDAHPVQEMRGHSNFHPRRGNMHNLPPHAFLQDDVMVQEVPSFLDHHSDMRLDIDDMSYEELLVLGEGIGNVGRGLLEEIIAKQMQTKTYLLPNNLEEQEIDLCIICQDEYKNKEEIGILQCGHEYHADCIRRWLHEKNVCPICKSTALAIG